jgi:hypothetical protein
MPAALTLQEKKERALAKQEEKMNVNVEEGRQRRRSVFNGTSQKLSVNKLIPGYHLHVFNDSADGRLQQALDSGYEFVSPEEVGGVSSNVVDHNTDIGAKVRYLVGSSESGPSYAYLMKIKQEWFDEDQVELQRRNDETDHAIKGGKLVTSGEGFYNAGISVKKG